MKHQITLSELNEFLHEGNKTEIAGSYGNGSHKSFIGISYFDERPATFIVEEHGKEVLKTENITEAVKAYNSYP